MPVFFMRTLHENICISVVAAGIVRRHRNRDLLVFGWLSKKILRANFTTRTEKVFN